MKSLDYKMAHKEVCPKDKGYEAKRPPGTLKVCTLMSQPIKAP